MVMRLLSLKNGYAVTIAKNALFIAQYRLTLIPRFRNGKDIGTVTVFTDAYDLDLLSLLPSSCRRGRQLDNNLGLAFTIIALQNEYFVAHELLLLIRLVVLL